MKLAKSLAVGALALALASVASAATLKITGSTAFRKSLYAAIINQGYNQAAYVGSTTSGLAGSSQAIFFNGTDYVEVCMAGSVGGVKWVGKNPSPENAKTSPTADEGKAWLKADGTITLAAATIGAGPSFTISGGQQEAASQAAVAAGSWDVAAPAQVTMSDSFQKSTPYTTGAGYNGLADSQTGVGVVSFTFAKGKKHQGIEAVAPGAYERFTNVSANAFQNLAASGVAPLEMFTGNPADRVVDVVLTGRDNDSGTRLAVNFETGYGGVDKFMTQYQFFAGASDAGSASGLSIDSLTAFNLTTGQAGYASGGSVKNVLLGDIPASTVDSNGRPFIILGYVGLADSPSAAQQLSYEGVPYSLEALNYGQYTFWTREHLYYRTTFTGTLKTLADNIAKNIKGVTPYTAAQGTAAASGSLIVDLKVSRASEGAVVNPSY